MDLVAIGQAIAAVTPIALPTPPHARVFPSRYVSMPISIPGYGIFIHPFHVDECSPEHPCLFREAYPDRDQATHELGCCNPVRADHNDRVLIDVARGDRNGWDRLMYEPGLRVRAYELGL